MTSPPTDFFANAGFTATTEEKNPQDIPNIRYSGNDRLFVEVDEKGDVIPNFLGSTVQFDGYMAPRSNFNVNVDGVENLTKLLEHNTKYKMSRRRGEKTFYDEMVNGATSLGANYAIGNDNGERLLTLQQDYKTLEEGFTRIMTAFAAIDGARVVSESNRRMMLRYMSENVSDATLARANYEVMVSNVNDMRDTYYRTQEKVMDMTRLNEVQTYYKMYYGAKKKIILETILVVVLLVILQTLRRNGILPEGLFNVFFVIVLFVYIFFRLSWQIADFMSRDKRYFDKYEWGQLDGSYNFYKFKDPPSEVSYSEKQKVNKCLDKFFKKLSNKRPTFHQLRSLLCSYEWMLQKDIEDKNTYMHTKMLYVVIYETLYHKYIKNANAEENKGVWDTCIKEELNECAKNAANQAADDDENKEIIVTKIVKNCNERNDNVKEALVKFAEYKKVVGKFNELEGDTKTKVVNEVTDNKEVTQFTSAMGDKGISTDVGKDLYRFKSVTKYAGGEWCIDPQGIIQIAYYFSRFYRRLREFLKLTDNDDGSVAMDFVSKMYFSPDGANNPNTKIIEDAYNNLSNGLDATSNIDRTQSAGLTLKALPDYEFFGDTTTVYTLLTTTKDQITPEVIKKFMDDISADLKQLIIKEIEDMDKYDKDTTSGTPPATPAGDKTEEEKEKFMNKVKSMEVFLHIVAVLRSKVPNK
jgi:hypothetical protein